MSLYEEEDLVSAATSDVASGWSKGIQLMQSHIQLKKAAAKTMVGASDATPSAVTSAPLAPTSVSVQLAPQKTRSSNPVTSQLQLAPVIDLNKGRVEAVRIGKPAILKSAVDRDRAPSSSLVRGSSAVVIGDKALLPLNDPNWQVINEYDPLWPNDYHKVVQELRDKRTAGEQREEGETRKRRYTEAGRERARERFHRDRGTGSHGSSLPEASGFSGRRRTESDDESEDVENRRRQRRAAGSSGAAIAPPPSLTESSHSPAPPPPSDDNKGGGAMSGLGVAAKIMAKYGYKQGQGLGRSQQGMAQALAVEKTSKRGGRIIHEKDLMPPPMFGESFRTPLRAGYDSAATDALQQLSDSFATNDDDAADSDGNLDGEALDEDAAPSADPAKPSITDLLKNPSKVVLCKNMVGPSEVDDELEPEVKEECNSKYGDVASVVIFELPDSAPEEAVRIFIEFKRVESAIKAVVDLNGRFFGGREVRASFYDIFQFRNLKLTD